MRRLISIVILSIILFVSIIVQAEPVEEILDTFNDVGDFSSIDFTNGGVPIVSYYDSTADNLKTAICNDAACSAPLIKLLDSGSDDAGKYSSLTLDSSNRPIVAYVVADTVASEEYIRVAACGDAVCTSASITRNNADTGSTASGSANRLGKSVSMELNNDIPIIAYINRDNSGTVIERPKIAFCGDRECTSSTVTTLDIYRCRFYGKI